MTNQDTQVVVAFDFSHSGRQALYRAIALAKRAPNHVLHFVCVIEPHGGVSAVPRTGPVDYHYTDQVQGALLDEIATELRAANIEDRVHFFVHARIGKPAEEILALAREVGADLLVIGTKGLTGLEHMVLGSVAEKVIREAGCAVVVARAKSYEYVPRLEVYEVPPDHKYIAPHRYTYEDNRVEMRPTDFPLY
jgi:nucleotide-binding universal stress UspA family protein